MHPILHLAVLGALVVGSGCAPKQRLSLACVPKTMTVVVDGETLDGVPDVIELRRDRAHSLAFVGGGYEKQFLFPEPRESDGEISLWPPDPCQELRFVEIRKGLELELELEGEG